MQDKHAQDAMQRIYAEEKKKKDEEAHRIASQQYQQKSISILENFIMALKKIFAAIFGRTVGWQPMADDKAKEKAKAAQDAGAIGSRTDDRKEGAAEKAAASLGAVAGEEVSAGKPAASRRLGKAIAAALQDTQPSSGLKAAQAVEAGAKAASAAVGDCVGSEAVSEQKESTQPGPAPVTPADFTAEVEAFMAAREGDVDKLDKCLQGGLSSDIRDIDGHTLLHIAARHGNVVATDFLLDQGLDPYAQDNNGKTPYDLATDLHIKERLAKKMDEIDVQEERGGPCPGS